MAEQSFLATAIRDGAGAGAAEGARTKDLFGQLLPASYRGVEFPVTRMRMSLAHDLAEHKYWGVDGARVESTGLAPMRFTFTVPLTLGIVPGKGEGWTPGTLYPSVFRALMKAFAEKAIGDLVHPEFGGCAVKAEKFDADWSGDRRGGCEVELSFVETKIGAEISDSLGASPVQALQDAVFNLDASKGDIKNLIKPYGLPEYKTTLSDTLRGVAAVADQVTLLSMRSAGQIDSVVYRVNAIADSVDRAKTALSWPVKRDVERVREAAHNLRQKLLQISKDIVVYAVPGDTTLAGVLTSIESSLGDLVKLNPQLMTAPAIPAGTAVRYYASRLAI